MSSITSQPLACRLTALLAACSFAAALVGDAGEARAKPPGCPEHMVSIHGR
jgi:sulfatase modifying factor 1